MKKYSKTIASGIESIGDIPEGWKLCPLKRVSHIQRGKFSHRPRNDPLFYDGDYPFIQTGDIEKSDGEIKSYSQTLNEKGLSVSRMFPKDTIVMAIAANIGGTAITTFPVCFPDSIVGFHPFDMDTKFLRFFLEAMKNYLNGIASITTQKNINYEFLKPLPISYPDKKEQKQIVSFILSKLALLNYEIQKNQKLIELFKEKKQSVINHAVTKGLDSDVDLQDSGIARIGKVPKHWKIYRISQKFDYLKNNITPEKIKDEMVFLYSIPYVQEFGTGQIVEGKSVESNKFEISGNEILISKLNPRKSTIVITEKNKLRTICSTEFLPLLPTDIDLKYAFYFLSSYQIKEYLSSYVNSATKSHQRISPEILIHMKNYFPEKTEQKQIVEFLDNHTKKINLLISKIEMQIEKLNEFKTSLIFSSVTGKINVGGNVS